MTPENPLVINEYTPSSVKHMGQLYAWVQAIVPFTYDNSLSYLEFLGKVSQYLNEMAQRQNQLSVLYDSLVDYTNTSIQTQVTYINNFVTSVRNEIIRFEKEMQDQYDEFTEDMTNQFNAFKTLINQTITNFETEMRNRADAFEAKINKTVSDLETDWSSYQTTMNNAWNAYQTTMNNAWNNYRNALNGEWQEMKEYTENYFATLDLESEVRSVLMSMYDDGTLAAILQNTFSMVIPLTAYGTEPTNPTDKDYYYNTTDNKLYQYVNNAWMEQAITPNSFYTYNKQGYIAEASGTTTVLTKGDMLVTLANGNYRYNGNNISDAAVYYPDTSFQPEEELTIYIRSNQQEVPSNENIIPLTITNMTGHILKKVATRGISSGYTLIFIIDNDVYQYFYSKSVKPTSISFNDLTKMPLSNLTPIDLNSSNYITLLANENENLVLYRTLTGTFEKINSNIWKGFRQGFIGYDGTDYYYITSQGNVTTFPNFPELGNKILINFIPVSTGGSPFGGFYCWEENGQRYITRTIDGTDKYGQNLDLSEIHLAYMYQFGQDFYLYMPNGIIHSGNPNAALNLTMMKVEDTSENMYNQVSVTGNTINSLVEKQVPKYQLTPLNYISGSALDNYVTTSQLTQTLANYVTLTALNNFHYTTMSDVETMLEEYETSLHASQTYQTKSDMSSYLTTASASSTYQTKADMSSYYTKTQTDTKLLKGLNVITLTQNITVNFVQSGDDTSGSFNQRIALPGGFTLQNAFIIEADLLDVAADRRFSLTSYSSNFGTTFKISSAHTTIDESDVACGGNLVGGPVGNKSFVLRVLLGKVGIV